MNIYFPTPPIGIIVLIPFFFYGTFTAMVSISRQVTIPKMKSYQHNIFLTFSQHDDQYMQTNIFLRIGLYLTPGFEQKNLKFTPKITTLIFIDE